MERARTYSFEEVAKLFFGRDRYWLEDHQHLLKDRQGRPLRLQAPHARSEKIRERPRRRFTLQDIREAGHALRRNNVIGDHHLRVVVERVKTFTPQIQYQ